MNHTPWRNAAHMSGDDYDAKFAAFERTGEDVHGEANFVASFGVSSILDAGCGTGRVAIELARRGFEVAGVDRDPEMLRVAREKAPYLAWHLQDLASMELNDQPASKWPRLFEAIIVAGNVMIFLDPNTEAAVLTNLARYLAPGGLLVAGFQLMANGLGLDRYDACAALAGFELIERWSTWNRDPWSQGSSYAVSVHRRRDTA